MARPKLTALATAAALALSVAPAGAAAGAQSDSGARSDGARPDSARSDSARRGPHVDRRIADPRVTESSGLALSNRFPGVLYTNEDSGNGAKVYALGRNGRTRAVLRVRGAHARDWEDLSTGPGRTLWIGDIGGNRGRRHVSVYRIKEPRRLHSQAVRSARFDFVYPDGAHNAEALLVRPRNGRVFIATKEPHGGALYRAPKHPSRTHMNRLRRVMRLPQRSLTAGAFAPRGRGFVVSNHIGAWLYDHVGAKPRRVRLPRLPQSESIEFTASGGRLLVGSERLHSRIWSIPKR